MMLLFSVDTIPCCQNFSLAAMNWPGIDSILAKQNATFFSDKDSRGKPCSFLRFCRPPRPGAAAASPHFGPAQRQRHPLSGVGGGVASPASSPFCWVRETHHPSTCHSVSFRVIYPSPVAPAECGAGPNAAVGRPRHGAAQRGPRDEPPTPAGSGRGFRFGDGVRQTRNWRSQSPQGAFISSISCSVLLDVLLSSSKLETHQFSFAIGANPNKSESKTGGPVHLCTPGPFSPLSFT